MLIDDAIKYWIIHRHLLDERTIKKAVGYSPYGIEYRIMKENGLVTQSNNNYDETLISNVDACYRALSRVYPKQMASVEEYFKRKSYQAVNKRLNCSYYFSKKYVHEGKLFLSALISVSSPIKIDV